MLSHGNYDLSLLSVSQLSTPTLNPTVSKNADAHRDSWEKQGIVVSQWVWGGLMILLAEGAIKQL